MSPCLHLCNRCTHSVCVCLPDAHACPVANQRASPHALHPATCLGSFCGVLAPCRCCPYKRARGSRAPLEAAPTQQASSCGRMRSTRRTGWGSTTAARHPPGRCGSTHPTGEASTRCTYTSHTLTASGRYQTCPAMAGWRAGWQQHLMSQPTLAPPLAYWERDSLTAPASHTRHLDDPPRTGPGRTLFTWPATTRQQTWGCVRPAPMQLRGVVQQVPHPGASCCTRCKAATDSPQCDPLCVRRCQMCGATPALAPVLTLTAPLCPLLVPHLPAYPPAGRHQTL